MKRHEMRALFNEAQECVADVYQLAVLELIRALPTGPVSDEDYIKLYHKIVSLRHEPSCMTFVEALRDGLAAYEEKK